MFVIDILLILLIIICYINVWCFFFRNEGMINIIVTIPEPLFIKSIDTEDHRFTGEHMCKIMEDVIEKYGALKFFTVTYR